MGLASTVELQPYALRGRNTVRAPTADDGRIPCLAPSKREHIEEERLGSEVELANVIPRVQRHRRVQWTLDVVV